MMSKVAFLGTGLLGSAMVERLLAQGEAVTVWNRTESKARALEPLGASVASTAEAAVDGAGRVHIALAEDAAVDSVLQSVVPRLGRDAIVIDHSTNAPARVLERSARMSAAGVPFLHAPVFMSPAMARAAKGLMLVSGAVATFEAVQPALATMTADVWYLGERPDLGAAYKLFGNAMLMTIVTGLADVLAMAGGLDIPALEAMKLFDRFQPGVAIPMRGGKMARRDYSAMFELRMARKDVGLMIDAAAGRPLAVLPGVAKRMDDAIRNGHGRDDLAAVAAEVVEP
jgi:3-hydroxyisobutyrate dehydrogenase-like beta-hydroxyacid dehydrogenase